MFSLTKTVTWRTGRHIRLYYSYKSPSFPFDVISKIFSDIHSSHFIQTKAFSSAYIVLIFNLQRWFLNTTSWEGIWVVWGWGCMFSLSLSSFPCGFFFFPISYLLSKSLFFLHNFMSKHSQAHHCIPEGHIGIIIIKLLKRLDKGWETAFERGKKKRIYWWML